MLTKGEDVKGGLEMARRHYVVSQRKLLVEKPFVIQKMGVRETPELGHSSRTLSEPRRHQWLTVESFRQVECMWVVGGAVRL